jgi:hypothetical protein
MMTTRSRSKSVAAAALPWLLLAGMFGGTAAQAQYKVVGPDGKVTYTDRAPTPQTGRVSPIRLPEAAPAGVALPADLQQPVARYPVVLYVGGGVCAACDAGRDLLRQRGIPFAEKQVVTAADGLALERITGARDVPALTIGGQTLRSYAAEVWTSYLDAAGYPKQSRLPASYQYAAATPLAAPPEGLNARGNAPAAVAPTTPQVVAPPPPAAPASGIRF